MKQIINEIFKMWTLPAAGKQINKTALRNRPITKIDHSTTSVDPVTYVGSIISNGHFTGSSVAF